MYNVYHSIAPATAPSSSCEAMMSCGKPCRIVAEQLALSQRLSPLGLIFRSPTSTSGKIILVNFRISLLKYLKLIKYYSRHYVLSKIALHKSFDFELLEL